MRSMQQQLGVLGTILQTQGKQENLCRDDRSQDLPDTDLQPTVRQVKYMGQQNKYECYCKLAVVSTQTLTDDLLNNTVRRCTTLSV